MNDMSYDYDVLVIGSGFGGSVSALRLTEKGYKVGVLEAGRRFDAASYPKTSWDVRRFLWAPRLGCYGIQRIHLLKDVVILAAAGVGGGSLVYANTLYEPPAPFYADPQWARITDWKSELAPCYDQAKRMLGVTANPELTAADKVMKEVAEDMGVGETFRSTPVGVFFGGPGTPPGTEVDDPFFGGQGPSRPSGTARGRRLDDLGQPGGQPIADHHRPGRTRHGVVAQQGPDRSPAHGGLGLPAPAPGRPAAAGGARARPGRAEAADRGRRSRRPEGTG